MPITSQEYEKVCVVGMTADLCGDESAEARRVIEESVDQRQIVDFVVDFSNCGFIDSAGLELLLWLKQKSDDLFGRVKLINLDENCRKILEMTRLERRFECCRDLASALKMMR